MEPTHPEHEDALPPTTDLSGDEPTIAINTGLLPTMASHCTRCGSELAADQRYCIVCGERRGEPRLPFMDGRGAPRPTAAVETVTTTTMAPPPARTRWSSGATLVAGVATLLLALGVGVLIGNAGKDDGGTASAAAPQVITVNGGAAAAATTTPTTATTASSHSKDKKSKDASTKAKAASTPQTSTVVTTDSSGIPKATQVVKKGQKGSGPGYKDGKFTGDFFGG